MKCFPTQLYFSEGIGRVSRGQILNVGCSKKRPALVLEAAGVGGWWASHGGWRLLSPVVTVPVVSVIVVIAWVPIGRFVGWRPEWGWPHEEHDDSQNHPGHGHHGERVVGATAIRTGQLTILAAFVVCAIGLWLAEEVEQPPHRHLVAENALTRVKVTPVSHLDRK